MGASSVTGIAVPTFSNPLPSTGGTNPTITTTVPATNAVNLGSGNTIRGLTVGNTTGAKLNAPASVGALTIGSAAGTSDVILNGTGQALNLTGGGTLAARFVSVSSDGGASGIVLTGLGGNLECPTTNIQNSIGTGVSVSNSVAGGAFNFGNTTANSSAGTGVSLSGNANNLTFADFDVTPDSGQRGVLAQNNTGTLTNSSGTVNTPNATAIEITGASAASRTTLNLTFDSVTANNASKGISLQNTAATASPAGGFRVVGAGTTDASGGAISSITGRGAEFINANGISLSNVAFNNVGTINGADPTVSTGNCGGLRGGTNTDCSAGIHLQGVTGATLTNVDMNGGNQIGINGNNVTNFSLSNSRIENFGDQVSEDGVQFQNLYGTSSIANCVITGNESRQIEVQNNAGNGSQAALTVSSTTLSNSAAPNGEDGVLYSGEGAANMKVTIQNSTFSNLRSSGVFSDFIGTATGETIITGSTFNPCCPGGAVQIVKGFSANVRFNISNNGTAAAPTFLGGNSNPININKQTTSTAGTTIQGTISGNFIGSASGTQSATTAGTGIRLVSTGDGTMTAAVTNNTVRGVTEHGILASIQENSSASNPALNVTVTGNTVNATDPLALNGIQINGGATSVGGNDKGTICADISSNTVASTSTNIRLRQRFATTIRLPGYGGANTDTAAVQSYLAARNSASTYSATVAVPPGGGFVVGAACTAPSFAQLENENKPTHGFENVLSSPNQSRQLSAFFNDVQSFDKAEDIFSREIAAAKNAVVKTTVARNTNFGAAFATFLSDTSNALSELTSEFRLAISPTAYAQDKLSDALAPQAGETVTKSLGTLPAGESITLQFTVTVNTMPTNFYSVTNTAQHITADGGIDVASNAVTTRVVQPLSIAKAFSPSNIVVGSASTLTFTLTNPNPAQALTQVTFSDAFPSDMVVANPASPTNTCGGAFAPAAGNTSVALTGGAIAAGGTCAVSVRVTAATVGAKNNVSGAVDSFETDAGNTASATLTVTNTIVWTGATGTDWNTASNWNPQSVPTATNDVNIPTGAQPNEPTIATPPNAVAQSLTLAAGRTLTIAANRTLTVTNQAAIDGILNVAGAFSFGSFVSTTGTVNFTGSAAQTIPVLAYNNLTVSDTAGAALSGTTTVGGVLTLTSGVLNAGSSTLIVSSCAPSAVSGGSASSYVRGNLQRCVNNSGAFVFPVGTANGFSPVQLSNIAGAGNFIVSATQGAYPNPATNLPANRLARWWTLTNGGIAQADVQFNYLAGDITAGTESNYKVFKIESGAATQQPTTLNAAAHTATVPGVSAFSDWTLAEVIAPTAAPAAISGRVLNAGGRGVPRARLTLVDSNGTVRYAQTNPFGYYRFTGVSAGETYILTAESKNKRFSQPTQLINLSEDTENVNFIALP